jgi:hypothetical protein
VHLKKKNGGVAQVVECLPSKCAKHEAKPKKNPNRKKKKKERKKNQYTLSSACHHTYHSCPHFLPVYLFIHFSHTLFRSVSLNVLTVILELRYTQI